MKPYGSIRVVRRWRGLRTNPVRGCFDDLLGLNNGLQVCELANGLRLGHLLRVSASQGKLLSIGSDRG
jgi:hypothetical protein